MTPATEPAPPPASAANANAGATKAHLGYLAELSTKASDTRKDYASAYSTYLDQSRRLGTDFQEQLAKAYQEYVESLANAWSLPEASDRAQRHYEAYLKVLTELTCPDPTARLSEQDQAHARLLDALRSGASTVAYQNYTGELVRIWDESDRLRRLKEEVEGYLKALGEITARGQQQVKDAMERYLTRLREITEQIDLPKAAERHYSEFNTRVQSIWEDVLKFNRDALDRARDQVRAGI